MKSWVKRDNYLTKVGERLLRGKKTFSLRRVHLVEPSGLSRGTVYNHFPREQDLILALCRHHLERRLNQAQLQELDDSHPLQDYLLHQCWVLWDNLHHRRFLPQRLLPNQEISSKASSIQQQRYLEAEERYLEWLAQSVSAAAKDNHMLRAGLLQGYVRGFLIQSDDQLRDADDISVYQTYCFGLTQLLGYDDVPAHFSELLTAQLDQWADADSQSQLTAHARATFPARQGNTLLAARYA